jgi:actin-related protein
MQPLDWMICYSLAAVLDAELRPKFASNILLVGGGANMVDLAEELEQRVIRRSADFELDVEKFEVKSMLREDYKP